MRLELQVTDEEIQCIDSGAHPDVVCESKDSVPIVSDCMGCGAAQKNAMTEICDAHQKCSNVSTFL